MTIKQSQLSVHHVLIVAYGRSRLRFAWRQFSNLLCCLFYERKHHAEWKSLSFQNLSCLFVAVISKVAGKDSGQMKVTTSLPRQLTNIV